MDLGADAARTGLHRRRATDPAQPPDDRLAYAESVAGHVVEREPGAAIADVDVDPCRGALDVDRDIAAGMARCVLVYRSRNRGSGGRPWAGTSRERDQSQTEGNETAFFSPYGFVRPVDQVAMFTRRFLHERGYTTRHLGWIAVSTRKHAVNNPYAMMREPITLEDHARSRIISDPLRLLDRRLADGTISPEDYARRKAILTGDEPPA